jgi:choline-sulfatase
LELCVVNSLQPALSVVVFLFACCCSAHVSALQNQPNVLFIAIDDQNDWIGALGGHPMAKTPNLDQLAARGEVFLNAHCQSPLCNPSRISLLLSLRPTTTGIYGLAPWFRELDEWKNRVSLPQYFRDNGYRTMAAGKIYHPFDDPQQLADEFQKRGPLGGVGPKPPHKLIPSTPHGNHPLMDWGQFPHRDEDKGDYQVTSWAVDTIESASDRQPFFLAVGFSLPHVPCYATNKWFELYPDDDSVLPAIRDDDRLDTPHFSWYLHWRLPEPRLRWVQDNHQWRNLVRSYLACTSFVDAQIGRLVHALESVGLAQNTIIVVWGDHGWHLGEKAVTGKNTLWERSTRVPLIFVGPGIPTGVRCEEPVELLDVYPTLVQLCRLPPRDDLEGISLVPQLQPSPARRKRPSITSHNQGNHGIRSMRWRYIRYADGSEELYDMRGDPHEWNNLANDARYAVVIAEHRKWLPEVDMPPAAGSKHRILTFDKASDTAVWEGETVRRGDPIPQ